MNGRKQDILFESIFNTDMKTGMESRDETCFYLWADAGMKKIIMEIEGVTNVFNNDSPTNYLVSIDRRYDMEWVKREIEAVIKCLNSEE